MALNYSPQIITDSLTIALDAADINSYPKSGATWYDISGNGNNAALANGISYSSANRGILQLDGTDDYIATTSVNTLGGISNHAFEMWIKSSGLGTGQSIGGLYCPDYGIITYIASDGNIVYYVYNTDAGYPGTYLFSLGTSGVNMFDNNWHHIVCTRGNGNPANIYVDGVLKVSSGNTGTWSGSTIWSSMPTYIGNNPNNVGYLFYGSMAVVKLYKKYLTAAEVTQNYNAQKSRFGL